MKGLLPPCIITPAKKRKFNESLELNAGVRIGEEERYEINQIIQQILNSKFWQ